MDEQAYAAFGRSAFGSISGSRIDRIRRHAGSSILDVGCGPGLYLERLSALGYQVSGVDGNAIFVHEAQKYTDQVYLVDLDAEGLSRFPDASFDTVLLFDLLEHVADDTFVLQEAARVARTNVLISVPAQIPEEMKNTQLVFASYVDPTHRRYYTFASLERLLQDSGFGSYTIGGILGFTPILFGIFPWYFRSPLKLLNRLLKRLSDPKILTAVWFAVGQKNDAKRIGK